MYLTLTACLVLLSAFAQTKNFIDQPYIEVSGTADTLVVPNLIYIKVIISEKDTRDKVPLEEQEAKMVEALKALGINTETDLSTSDVLSNYKYYLLKQKDVIKSKEYILKVTSAETASKVFMALEDLDISNTSIHRVDHSELEQLRNRCRSRAINNAVTKATSLTQPISQRIGIALHIADHDAPNDAQLQGRVAGLMIRGYSSFSKDKIGPPKIEFEKIRVSATVQVKFMLLGKGAGG